MNGTRAVELKLAQATARTIAAGHELRNGLKPIAGSVDAPKPEPAVAPGARAQK